MAWRKESYPHQQQMPFAREPLKTIYVAQRLLTTLLLVPCWVLYYTLMPRSRRPRPSWSLKQIITVNFTRRVYKVTELAGVTWGTRDPGKGCDNLELKETRFEWVDALPEKLRSGILVDEQVPFKRVGTFVWPKVNKRPYKRELGQDDLEAGKSKQPVIGIFLHGGGYCHMSAHENAKTSKIPRRLIKDKAFDEIYAVEYRLLQHAPFPAAVQDAAAVYLDVLRRYTKVPPSPSSTTGEATVVDSSSSNLALKPPSLATMSFKPKSKHEKENDLVHLRVAESSARKNCKIILIGDSAGGNLVLALARWIRDEGVLPPPDGLLLLSPSCDPSHAFPDSPSEYVPRPHGSTDYLVDTPEPRALLQRTFLGHNPIDTIHSPYVSPASQRVLRAFYGELFAANVGDLTISAFNSSFLEEIRTMPTTPLIPQPGMITPVTPGEGPLSNSLAYPVMAAPRGLSLFSEFSRVCVVLGDAERLEREVMKLVGAMENDGVTVRTVWVKDGVHDVLMLGWWDEQVRDKVWTDVEQWVGEVTVS